MGLGRCDPISCYTRIYITVPLSRKSSANIRPGGDEFSKVLRGARQRNIGRCHAVIFFFFFSSFFFTCTRLFYAGVQTQTNIHKHQYISALAVGAKTPPPPRKHSFAIDKQQEREQEQGTGSDKHRHVRASSKSRLRADSDAHSHQGLPESCVKRAEAALLRSPNGKFALSHLLPTVFQDAPSWTILSFWAMIVVQKLGMLLFESLHPLGNRKLPLRRPPLTCMSGPLVNATDLVVRGSTI